MPKTSVRNYFFLKKKVSRLDCIASLFLWKKTPHLFDEVVLLSIEKYLQGHLRRGEFRVGSNRKIQRHLSFGTSGTMARGGGPRSRQPGSVSRVLIFRLNTLSWSTCFGSPSIILQILLVIGCCSLPDSLSSMLPSVLQINIAARSGHGTDGFIQHFQSGHWILSNSEWSGMFKASHGRCSVMSNVTVRRDEVTVGGDRTSERIKTRHLFIQIFRDTSKIANEIL